MLEFPCTPRVCLYKKLSSSLCKFSSLLMLTWGNTNFVCNSTPIAIDGARLVIFLLEKVPEKI